MAAKKKVDTVVDAHGQCVRCEVCGEEVPFPIGVLAWVAGYIRAFDAAHAGCTGKVKGFVSTGVMEIVPACQRRKGGTPQIPPPPPAPANIRVTEGQPLGPRGEPPDRRQ